MGGVPQFTFTEQVRSRMCFVIAVVNWVSIVTSLFVAGIGTYIKLQVQEYTNLVKGYDGDTLPYLLVALGLLSAVINAAGGFIIFFSADPVKRFSLRHVLLGYVLTTLILCILVLVGGTMCFAHIQHLDQSFKGGLKAAMRRYKDTPHIKTELDQLQQSYRCCGNEGYTDWFHVTWVNEKYLNVEASNVKKKVSKGQYQSDDVPFSCCSVKSHRPCIHHHVHDNSRHFNYDFRAYVTLYRLGCRKALMNFLGDDLLSNAGIVVLSIFVLQLLLATVTRLLQTSLGTALEQEDPLGPSPAYIFPTGGTSAAEPTDAAATEQEAPVSQKQSVKSHTSGKAPLLQVSQHHQPYEVFHDTTWDDSAMNENTPLQGNAFNQSLPNFSPAPPVTPIGSSHVPPSAPPPRLG